MEHHHFLIRRADVVIEALPYIKKFYGKTVVIKYGGAAMADDNLKSIFAKDIALLKFVGLNPVIVHGGGKDIDYWLNEINIKPKFIDGIRVTDKKTMEVVEFVLSGKVNKEIVNLMSTHGVSSVGLSGKDGNLIVGKKKYFKKGKKKIDLMYTGDVDEVNPIIIETLIAKNFIPIISPVSGGYNNETYNINADEVASALAGALHATKLFFLSDVDGIIDENKKLISRLSIDRAKKMIKDKVITGGMIPKVECAIESINKGTESVHIINGRVPHAILLEIFTDHGIGSMIS